MSKEISKWSDDFMFKAEPSKASEGTKAFLLGAPVDPLGQIAACAKMYKGEVVRDLADVTDAERAEYLQEIQKTVLKMPLEAVDVHFMVEGIHRGITHQMVRQRTAAFAQESTRFAVKEDLADATALPPSLDGTLDIDSLRNKVVAEWQEMGIHDRNHENISDEDLYASASQKQRWRIQWDEAVSTIDRIYNGLVNDGMPAEDARGLMPTNITTRLNYKTNLRSFYDTMAVRVSDQAQFEWRMVAMALAKAMIEYGEKSEYKVWVPFTNDLSSKPGFKEVLEYRGTSEDGNEPAEVLVAMSSAWQWKALAHEIKPIEFKIGGPAFGANFDRPSRIGERVRAFHECGVPSSEWTKGSEEFGIPPIRPEEWLLDPQAARLGANEEFDIFGNRVPKGTGMHWDSDVCAIKDRNGKTHHWAPVA